jgi:hypothetical protein
MKFVLLSALAHTAVLAGDTSKNMLVDRGGEHRTKYLRKLKKDLSVSLQGEIVDGNEAFAPTGEDSKNWNRGSYAVASKHSGTIKLHVPQDTQIGDTLFLFLR